ncbi:MAG: hypothetical protein EXR39_01850 [Betaproteobacteria bacterium]|nr:hypothetical protein [Betaproteobacteria bacterium]
MVEDDQDNGLFRVNRRAFIDPAVMEEEKRTVFGQSWLYVGHESELPEPGSFVRREVAWRPVIMVRDEAGTVRILFDTCPHRGNTVCKEAAGKTKRFQCFYHGWTFNTRGELISVPDSAGYGPGFDKKNFPLATPPRVETYRGLVFMSLKADIVDLVTYFGRAKEYLDLILNHSEDVEIVPGQQSYSMRANWKLLVENSIDGYHAMMTHERYFIDYMEDLGGSSKDWESIVAPIPGNTGIELDSGHAVIENPIGKLPMSANAAQHLGKVRAELEAKFGREYTERMVGFSRNLFIFPNLIFVQNFRTVRTFYPASPDYLKVNAWALLPKGEPAAIRRLRHDNFISFLGPGGFGTPDDVEALENCQRGFAVREMEWSDISRGMKRPPTSSDEIQMRAFWRRWYQCLYPSYAPQMERPVPAQVAAVPNRRAA